MNNLITINNDTEAEIVEKKSKFIANVFYVEGEDEVIYIINNIKKKHYSAKHYCYAYRIMVKDSIIEKSSDDGEPSGTAGAPILNILQKNNMVNVLVVVTRYFGGILLGTGGLVKAYSDSTKSALLMTKNVNIEPGYEIELEVEYNELEKLKYFCKNNNIVIVDEDYNEKIKIQIEIAKNKMEILEKFCKNNKKNHNIKILKEKNIKLKNI